jgi:hypothetical protein
MRSIITTSEMTEILAKEIGIYWIQSGRIPSDDDMEGVRVQASAIVADLPVWISAKDMTSAVRMCRRKSKTIPAPSAIIECAEWTRNQSKSESPTDSKALPAPQTLDCWQELAFARLYPLNAHRSKTPWVEDMLTREPTKREADGFIRLFIALAPSIHDSSRKLIIQSNARKLAEQRPYGYGYEDILRRCREHLESAQLNF